MNRIHVEKRLEQLERAAAALRPAPDRDNDPLAWAHWASNAELDELEQIARHAMHNDGEVTVDQYARFIELELACTRRQLASAEPLP